MHKSKKVNLFLTVYYTNKCAKQKRSKINSRNGINLIKLETKYNETLVHFNSFI